MRSRLLHALTTATLVLGAGCGGPGFVDQVDIVNPTRYPAAVDVRGRTGGWVDLTTAPAGETREVSEVIDQGEIWTFRFSYGDHAVVDITKSRSELADAEWRVEVPRELEDELQAEGVPIPP